MATSNSAGEQRRHFKPLRTMQKSEEGKALHHEQRRREFLQKVRRKGEDRKWDMRGEQMLREDFLESERRWIESLDRSAPAPLIYPEEDDMKETKAQYETHAIEMIDQVVSQQNDEVDALVSLLEEHSEGPGLDADRRIDYGSDDENYDSIFMSMVSDSSEADPWTINTRQVAAEASSEAPTSEAMDTTGG